MSDVGHSAESPFDWRELAELRERYPCDGMCSDYPEEDCSRHGRTPADLWGLLLETNKALQETQARAESLREWATAMTEWLAEHPDHDLTAEDVAANALARDAFLRGENPYSTVPPAITPIPSGESQ